MQSDGGGGGGAGIAGAFMSLVWLAIMVLVIMGAWKTFTKAGKPGWASIVPIYNTIVMLEIAGKPAWWFLMFFIPIVNIYFAVKYSIALAASFGKSTGFGIGLLFLAPIFYIMLGFGDAQYRGPVPEGMARAA